MTPEQLARSDEKADALGIGHLINSLRKSRGLTQSQLAEKLGVTQQAVSKIEWGEDVQLSTLHKVFAALGGELYLHASGQQIPLSLPATVGSPIETAVPQ
jgi:transcriptional regulator with XRE-family HTH domain